MSTHYDIDMSLHYARARNLARERWMQCLDFAKKCKCEECVGPDESQVA